MRQVTRVPAVAGLLLACVFFQAGSGLVLVLAGVILAAFGGLLHPVQVAEP